MVEDVLVKVCFYGYGMFDFVVCYCIECGVEFVDCSLVNVMVENVELMLFGSFLIFVMGC